MLKLRLLATFALCLCVQVCSAQVSLPIQSPAKPLGLSPIGPVMTTGSDARAADFNVRILPAAIQIVEKQLKESVVFAGRSTFKLDSAKLFLWENPARPIRVYFVSEGAGYHNSLGYSLADAGRTQNSYYRILLPDASIGSTRTQAEPLRSGDFIDIPEGSAGQQLDFFLVSDGARGYTGVLWNDEVFNPDKLQHVTAFQLPDPNFLLLGIEDIIGGGDLDYNDCVLVVDFGFDFSRIIELPN